MTDSTDVTIDSHEAFVLKQFIEEHWRLFLNHAEYHGIDESDCDNLCKKLDE